MASIGPQLPPQLSKRKRTPEDESDAPSPPSKLTRHTNEDEIDLGSDSDDSYGPRAPAPDASIFKTAVQTRIGPALTPKVNNEAEIPLDSDEDDTCPAPPPSHSIGPTKPPHQSIPPDSADSDSSSPAPSRAKTIGPSLPPTETKRIIGPAPPPADLSSLPPADSDSDSSDSDYGPALPTAAEAARAAERRDSPQGRGGTAGSGGPPAPQRRDDWMLAPPTGSDFTGRIPDPTQLKKPRKFGSGRGPNPAAGGGVSSIWTETADEKRKRLADAVLGRGPDPADEASHAGGASGRERAAAERDAQIQANMEAVRGESLYARHQTALKEGRAGGRSGAKAADDDDPSKRAFDKEKDMALGGRITGSQRKELLNRAANFGGRFQKGSYL